MVDQQHEMATKRTIIETEIELPLEERFGGQRLPENLKARLKTLPVHRLRKLNDDTKDAPSWYEAKRILLKAAGDFEQEERDRYGNVL